jgi:serine/threonine protein phosphatase PrpC
MGRVGSCALICLVYNNKVYCANAGDSLGLLIEKTPKEMVYT